MYVIFYVVNTKKKEKKIAYFQDIYTFSSTNQNINAIIQYFGDKMWGNWKLFKWTDDTKHIIGQLDTLALRKQYNPNCQDGLVHLQQSILQLKINSMESLFIINDDEIRFKIRFKLVQKLSHKKSLTSPNVIVKPDNKLYLNFIHSIYISKYTK